MNLGSITENFKQNAKLGYYVNNGNQDYSVYNEVHLYPLRGDNNLNGWDTVVSLN